MDVIVMCVGLLNEMVIDHHLPHSLLSFPRVFSSSLHPLSHTQPGLMNNSFGGERECVNGITHMTEWIVKTTIPTECELKQHTERENHDLWDLCDVEEMTFWSFLLTQPLSGFTD